VYGVFASGSGIPTTARTSAVALISGETPAARFVSATA
jgi:hypothetical protein